MCVCVCVCLCTCTRARAWYLIVCYGECVHLSCDVPGEGMVVDIDGKGVVTSHLLQQQAMESIEGSCRHVVGLR